VSFTTPAAALLATIKPEKTADFEALLQRYVDALRKSDDPARVKMADAFRVYKASEPAPGGSNVLYVLTIDPVDPQADYSWKALLNVVYAANPDQAASLFEKATTVHAAPMNKLSLTPLGWVAPQAAPATPK
jgi:hypothetical protein